jgi:hypothetical protein
MNWQAMIDQQLDRIAQDGPLPSRPAPLTLTTPHGVLHGELTAIDSIGCAFEHLWLQSDALAHVTVPQLRSLGRSLTERLSYLLEPIANLELDAEGFSLQLRSHPPQRDEDGRRYYELTARRGGEVRLCRYAKQPGQPRQVVTTRVTREVLGRLVRDFDTAVVDCSE